MDTRHAVVDSLIGQLTIVATDDAIVGIYFPQHWTNPARETFGPVVDVGDDPVLQLAHVQLDEYLRGERTSFDLPTAPSGNAFQQGVWDMLTEIPFGETITYGEIAERMGDRRLARMVGQAVGHNPLSIIVPCHRVVSKAGKLTGYAGGLERKRFLLQLEDVTHLGPELGAVLRLF